MFVFSFLFGFSKIDLIEFVAVAGYARGQGKSQVSFGATDLVCCRTLQGHTGKVNHKRLPCYHLNVFIYIYAYFCLFVFLFDLLVLVSVI